MIGMVGVWAGMGAGVGNLEEDAAVVAGWAGPITCCKLRPQMAARFQFCLLLGFSFGVLQKSLL